MKCLGWHCLCCRASPCLIPTTPTVPVSPPRSLDLSKFCIGRKGEQQLPMYDLYAVINHYGGMIGGHYTAYARLPNDKNSQRSDVGEDLLASLPCLSCSHVPSAHLTLFSSQAGGSSTTAQSPPWTRARW